MRPLLLGALLLVAGAATFIALRRRRMSRAERVKLMAAQVAAQAARPVRQAQRQYRWFQRGMRVGRSVEAVGRGYGPADEGAPAKLGRLMRRANREASRRKESLATRSTLDAPVASGSPDRVAVADVTEAPDLVVAVQPTEG